MFSCSRCCFSIRAGFARSALGGWLSFGRAFAGGRFSGRFASTRLSRRLSGGRFAFSLRNVGAAPRFENSDGRDVAASSGRPWFTEANRFRLVAAVC